MDLSFACNKTLAVVGPSHCGKTYFTLKFLDKRHQLFKEPINRVVWCYGIHQPSLIKELEVRKFITHDGIIPVDEIQSNDIIVLDDLLNQSNNSKDVTDMFTRAAHHKPCFIIFIMQNLFPPGKEARTRSLNTHYYAIFKNPRDQSQFSTFARQVLPKKSKALINIFAHATRKPYQYLFLDFTQECDDDYRFRGDILSGPVDIYKAGPMGDFTQMVAIPRQEYTQLTTIQNARQPLTEQLHRLENNYQSNALIPDPYRSISLQSQTIERMKDLKDQMRNYLTVSTPKPYRNRAESLFQSLEPHLNVNELGEVIKDDGSVIKSSRYEDLIQHAVRDRRRNFSPAGWDYFVGLLKRQNVPRSVLNRDTIDEVDSPKPLKASLPQIKKQPPSPTGALKPSKLRLPQIFKRTIKTSPTSVPKQSNLRFPQIYKRTIKTSPTLSTKQSERRGRTLERKSPSTQEKRRRAPPRKYMFENY